MPDPCRIHYMRIQDKTNNLANLTRRLRTMSGMDFAAMQKSNDGIVAKSKFDMALQFGEALGDFTCARCGAKLGNTETWGTDHVLVVDSLMGVNDFCMQLVVGGGLITTLPQYGTAIDTEVNIIKTLTESLTCHVVVTAHEDRIADELHGGTYIALKAIGQKAAPRIIARFDEVIQQQRHGDKFNWATTSSKGAQLKSRLMPISPSLPPSFVPLYEAWKAASPEVGFKALLQGESGSGKTHALSTLADIPGLTVAVIFLENGTPTLMKALSEKGAKPPIKR